jgi:hypothetical protein
MAILSTSSASGSGLALGSDFGESPLVAGVRTGSGFNSLFFGLPPDFGVDAAVAGFVNATELDFADA